MSLHKAIASGKEHRIEYGTKGQPYCKAIDPHCRNHGNCPWCSGNRTYKNKEKERLAKEEISNYKKTNNYINLEKEELIDLLEKKDRCFKNIIDIGFDYDGYNDVENLKGIIDEFVEISKNALGKDVINYF